MPNTPRTRSQANQARDTVLETPPPALSRNRSTVTTASSVSSGPSPSSFRKRQNELRNSRDEDIDEDSTYYGGALLKTRPDLLTEASERAAEKLQAALEGSSIEEHFTKFIPNDVMRKIIMRQKAMKNLVVKHREFWTGDSLKPLKELSTNEFVKLMRLCFGNETGDLSGAQQQILRALHGKPLTYTNYVELEDACLQIAQISETYALNSQTQRNIVTLAIKQLRSEHPPADTNHEEAKALLDRVVAKGAIYTIDEFTCEVLSELCENKTVVAAIRERGLSNFGMPTKTNTDKRLSTEDPPDEEPQGKRQKTTCFACGREGHKKTVCSFMEQKHPDVNLENKPWAESTKGRAWASKNKDILPGTQTLSGAPFTYVSTRK